jgi:hypothetical protein
MVDKTAQTAETPDPPETEDERIERIVNARLAERDAQVAGMVAASRSLSGATVPANSDGPGYGNPQPSWNLAQQEAASSGMPWE